MGTHPRRLHAGPLDRNHARVSACIVRAATRTATIISAASSTLREVRDFKGQELVDGVLALADRHRPLHVSIVGGEPLVRYRELDTLLPLLAARAASTCSS